MSRGPEASPESPSPAGGAGTGPLAGRRVAVPESRELDLFARMLEERGARTLRCPLVSILDAPDPAPVEAWLRRFTEGRMQELILLTGEGLRRLLGFAERAGLRRPFVEALGRVRTVTRGPKPARALRELGLRPSVQAPAPTTEGVIAALAPLDLEGHRVGVQLYGGEPNLALRRYLESRGAQPDPVAPYVYASEAEDERVLELIRELAAGRVDAIAFTSALQVRRLEEVARRAGLEEDLRLGLERTVVAAVGPVVAEALRRRGVEVDVMPAESFFMKPLVRELSAALGAAPEPGGGAAGG